MLLRRYDLHLLVCGSDGFWGKIRDVEGQAAVAKGDLIARLDLGGSGDLLAVKECAVLRGDIVQFAPEIVVDDHRTVPARNALISDHYIVVREPAHTVQPEMERVNICSILEVKRESGCGWKWRSRRRTSNGRSLELVLINQHPEVAGECEISTRGLNSLPRSAELVPPGLALQVQAVKPGI
jgi:hypothetical protein